MVNDISWPWCVYKTIYMIYPGHVCTKQYTIKNRTMYFRTLVIPQENLEQIIPEAYWNTYSFLSTCNQHGRKITLNGKTGCIRQYTNPFIGLKYAFQSSLNTFSHVSDMVGSQKCCLLIWIFIDIYWSHSESCYIDSR